MRNPGIRCVDALNKWSLRSFRNILCYLLFKSTAIDKQLSNLRPTLMDNDTYLLDYDFKV